MIRNALNKIAPHKSDYSYLHTFGALAGDPKSLPTDFTIYDGRAIPNQGTFDDRFVPALRPLPAACTAESQTFLAGLEDDALYPPDDFYFATPPGTDYEGRDMRASMETTVKRGFRLPTGDIGAKRSAYFNCYGAGAIDDFDAARIALWLNQNEKCGVSVGMWWYYEFATPNPVTDSLPLPSFDTGCATLHNVVVTGWRTRDTIEELEVISWQGMGYGDKGRVWMSRQIYNAIMAQPWTAAYIITKTTSETPVAIGFTAILDHLIYYVRQLFHL